jgi:hypothetical protein
MFRLGAARPQLYVEFNLFAFAKCSVSLFLDRAVMNKNIRSRGLGYKPVSLGVVEPLHGTGNSTHIRSPVKLEQPAA